MTATVTLYDGIPFLRNPTSAYAPGAVSNSNPGLGAIDGDLAFGGFRAQDPKPVRLRMQFPAGNVMRTHRNVQVSEAAAGLVSFRCLFLEVNASCTTLNVWLQAATTTGLAAMAIGIDPAAANTQAAIIVAETAAPAGVAFSSPVSSGTALTLGAMTVPANKTAQSRALWVRRTISAGAAAFQGDSYILNVSVDGGAATQYLFWWHVLKGVAFLAPVPVVNDHAGLVVSPQNVVVFTASVVTAGTTTAADPAGNQVFVGVTATTTDSAWGPQPYQGQLLLDQCVKTATGSYRYEWTPPLPGHYHLTFDCGDDTAFFSMWVSPVGGKPLQ